VQRAGRRRRWLPVVSEIAGAAMRIGIAWPLMLGLAALGLWKLCDIVYWLFMHIAI
jgi:hypothetical protein